MLLNLPWNSCVDAMFLLFLRCCDNHNVPSRVFEFCMRQDGKSQRSRDKTPTIAHVTGATPAERMTAVTTYNRLVRLYHCREERILKWILFSFITFLIGFTLVKYMQAYAASIRNLNNKEYDKGQRNTKRATRWTR